MRTIPYLLDAEAISAAGDAGMYIIPLAWTLYDSGESFTGASIPRMQAVTSVRLLPEEELLKVTHRTF